LCGAVSGLGYFDAYFFFSFYRYPR
jgi:hypothetical protein